GGVRGRTRWSRDGRTRQVPPAPNREFFVADAPDHEAPGATWRPAALKDEHQPRVGGQVVAGYWRDRPSVLRLPAVSDHLPASKASNLCENRRALAHPGDLTSWRSPPGSRPRGQATRLGKGGCFAYTDVRCRVRNQPISEAPALTLIQAGVSQGKELRINSTPTPRLQARIILPGRRWKPVMMTPAANRRTAACIML